MLLVVVAKVETLITGVVPGNNVPGGVDQGWISL